MSSMIATKRQLRGLRAELRSRQAERKAWRTGTAFADRWGTPWCTEPGADHCQGTGCEGCAVADYCRDRADEINTSALEQAITALTPQKATEQATGQIQLNLKGTSA